MRGETEPLVVQLPNLVIGEVQHLWVLDKFHLTSYLNPLHTSTHFLPQLTSYLNPLPTSTHFIPQPTSYLNLLHTSAHFIPQPT